MTVINVDNLECYHNKEIHLNHYINDNYIYVVDSSLISFL